MYHTMYHRRTTWLTKSFTVTALMAAMVWLAACSTTPTTSTTEQAPTAAAASAAATSTTTEDAPAEAPTTEETTEETTVEESTTEEAAMAVVKLNLNSASNDEFLTVPSVGDRMVREFNEYRPYISILQFRREIGKYVDDEQVAAYEEYLYVPIAPNEADAETLQQIPGVTPEIADALIASRPYASNAAFVDALAAHITADELAIGETYLETE